MAISLVGTPQHGNAINGNNVTLTFDVAPAQNDVVVVFGGHGAAVTTLAAPTPATYTQIGIHTGSAPIFGAWYKVMGATPDTNVVCSGGGSASDAVAYCSYVLRGVNTGNVLDAAAVTAGPTTSTNPDAPAIVPVTATAWIIAMAGSQVNDTSPGTVSGYTNQVTDTRSDTNPFTTAGATLTKDPAASDDPAAWSTWASGTWFTITAAIRPAEVARTLTGVAATFSAGSIKNAVDGLLVGSVATFSAGALKSTVVQTLTGSVNTFATGTITPTVEQGATGDGGYLLLLG